MGELLFPAFDPVLLDLPGPFDLRWYGLMYVVGFVLAQHILKRFCRAGFLPMNEQQVADFILWQVLGVILGGRLGYMFFYRPDFLKDPQELVRVWEGGLSFHGGLLGVCAVFVWFARKHKVPVLRLGDASAMAVVPGIFAVRVANFINGELYGRITDASVPWAMRFPTDPVAQRLLGVEAAGIRERELKTLQAIGDGTWARVMDRVPLRHPSQIYEAIGEGLLLGLMLYLVYRATRGRPLGAGAYGGLFLLGYGVARFVVEFFRQPDKQFEKEPGSLGTVLGPFSMGQVLCSAMIVAGVVFLARGKRAAVPA